MTSKGKVLRWDKLKVKLKIGENVTIFTNTALCAEHDDPELWYSEGDIGNKNGGDMQKRSAEYMARTHQAIQICNACPSKATCLEEGMRKENLDWGVWGGLMAGERLVLSGIPLGSTDRKNKILFAKRVRARYGS